MVMWIETINIDIAAVVGFVWIFLMAHGRIREKRHRLCPPAKG